MVDSGSSFSEEQLGAGVPYEAYGAACVSGQGGFNRPAFMQDLTGMAGSQTPRAPTRH